MISWTVKNYRNDTWTTLGTVHADTREQAWSIASLIWGNRVSHVTDFLE